MFIQFTAGYKVIHPHMSEYGQDDIKVAPQMWRMSPEYARKLNNPIVTEFLDKLPWKPKFLDSRVHMLMKNMYPCIPGWHLDDVPRNRLDKQPNHKNPSYYSEHCAVVLGTASLTEFLIGDLQLRDLDEYEGNVYQQWHEDIQGLLKEGDLRSQQIVARSIVNFGWGGFHQGMPATHRGWRMFMRATRHTDVEPENELRKQTQVYLTNPFEGW